MEVHPDILLKIVNSVEDRKTLATLGRVSKALRELVVKRLFASTRQPATPPERVHLEALRTLDETNQAPHCCQGVEKMPAWCHYAAPKRTVRATLTTRTVLTRSI
jgi:hypothetical protein